MCLAQCGLVVLISLLNINQPANLQFTLLPSFDVLDARTLHLKLEDFQVHDVASVLRRFIRSLSEPLLTENLRSRWMETASTCACIFFANCFYHAMLC